MSILKAQQLSKRYRSREVVKNVSLELSTGEIVGLLGPNGAGKTTSFYLIVGLIRCNQGQVFLDDQDITQLSEEELSKVQKNFSYVFQGGALFDSMTVGENVAFGLKQLGQHPPATIREIVKEKLAVVGLQGIESLKPSELSGGMRKRVAIAR